MTGYGADEVIERMEAALCTEHLACLAAREQRDSARDIAVALEQENALLSWLLAEAREIAETCMGPVAWAAPSRRAEDET